MTTDLDIDAGPAAWYGHDLQNSTEWAYVLTSADIAILERELNKWPETLPFTEIPTGKIDLGPLADVLRDLGHELESGRGFFLIRGLPVEHWSEQRCAQAFWIVGCRLGRPVSQNAAGELIGHVRDTGADFAQPTVRGYATSDRLYYHTDHSDSVGLLCLKPARAGGLSTLASAVTVHNELVRRRPDLVPLLHKTYAFDYRGEQPPGTAVPYYESPVYTTHGGRLSVYISKPLIDKAQRFDGVEPLTPAAEEALELMQQIAGEVRVRLDMDFAPGDIQFLSNYSVLHSRTAFEDYPEPERRRHLLRLWLRLPDSRALPERFGLGTRNTSVGGGIFSR
ncbi:TauD/TfdA family dioxygenase [Mycolicibacterium stellerae]|uniref:TauD/TfdA family dioxygenase n=1 Tax=Mycolicibacterium stellerae TaxID=2358193 RepID=UPI000F0B7198|nr:TauD/TfdA family dioxygenase [Mycolicibacterium stellerae]